MTKIEWVRNADGSLGKTWNPIVGCSIVSPGCTNCYAMRMAARLDAMGMEKARPSVEAASRTPANVWRVNAVLVVRARNRRFATIHISPIPISMTETIMPGDEVGGWSQYDVCSRFSNSTVRKCNRGAA